MARAEFQFLAQNEKPRERGPGFKFAKVFDGVDQKLTRTPAVVATLVFWMKPLAMPPWTCENITPA